MKQKTKNENSTRYYSSQQESQIADMLGGVVQPNSGAGLFNKSDILISDASLLIECKTVTKEKDSFSVKKDWIKKNKDEAFSQRVFNGCIAFNFGPGQSNYFVIDEKLMKFLVEKLEEENI